MDFAERVAGKRAAIGHAEPNDERVNFLVRCGNAMRRASEQFARSEDYVALFGTADLTLRLNPAHTEIVLKVDDLHGLDAVRRLRVNAQEVGTAGLIARVTFADPDSIRDGFVASSPEDAAERLLDVVAGYVAEQAHSAPDPQVAPIRF